MSILLAPALMKVLGALPRYSDGLQWVSVYLLVSFGPHVHWQVVHAARAFQSLPLCDPVPSLLGGHLQAGFFKKPAHPQSLCTTNMIRLRPAEASPGGGAWLKWSWVKSPDCPATTWRCMLGWFWVAQGSSAINGTSLLPQPHVKLPGSVVRRRWELPPAL